MTQEKDESSNINPCKPPPEDPTKFIERSFACVWNEGHSIRLINRDNPRWAISIPWDEISALRALLGGTRPVTDSFVVSDEKIIELLSTESSESPSPSPSPGAAAAREIENVLIARFHHRESLPPLDDIIAIIDRHCSGAPVAPVLTPEGCLLSACDTGDGWCLMVETPDGDVFAYLAWPDWWPKELSASELRERGFDIQPA